MTILLPPMVGSQQRETPWLEVLLVKGFPSKTRCPKVRDSVTPTLGGGMFRIDGGTEFYRNFNPSFGVASQPCFLRYNFPILGSGLRKVLPWQRFICPGQTKESTVFTFVTGGNHQRRTWYKADCSTCGGQVLKEQSRNFLRMEVLLLLGTQVRFGVASHPGKPAGWRTRSHISQVIISQLCVRNSPDMSKQRLEGIRRLPVALWWMLKLHCTAQVPSALNPLAYKWQMRTPGAPPAYLSMFQVLKEQNNFWEWRYSFSCGSKGHKSDWELPPNLGSQQVGGL